MGSKDRVKKRTRKATKKRFHGNQYTIQNQQPERQDQEQEEQTETIIMDTVVEENTAVVPESDNVNTALSSAEKAATPPSTPMLPYLPLQ